MTTIHFSRLTKPTTAIAETFSRWENDQQIRHLARPHRNQADLTKQHRVTIDRLSHQLHHMAIYLIDADQRLIW